MYMYVFLLFVQVLMFNHSSKPYEVEKFERVAQVIFTRVAALEVRHLQSLGPQHATNRGEDGLGSSGRF